MAGEFASSWRVLTGCTIGAMVGVSSLYFYSLGIFMKPMQMDFGWTRGEASLGALVGTACAALMSIPTGWIVDRLGSARVAVISLLLLAASFAALGTIRYDLAGYLAIVSVLSLLTVGSTPLPFTRLIVSNFSRHRGLALGITLAGIGMGAILVPRLLAPFVAEYGWRKGYLALATVVALVAPIVALLLQGASEATQERSATPAKPIASSSALYVLVPMFLLASIAVLGTVVHFVPMLTDSGLTTARAGAMASTIGIAALGGRLVVGLLLDRAPAAAVTASLFAICSVGLIMLATHGADLAVVGAIVLGLAIGTEADLLAYLVSRTFPRQAYGRAYGAVLTAFLIGGALGPYVAGVFFDRFASYSLWLFLAGALLAAAAGLSLLLSRQIAAPDRREGAED